MIFIPRNFWGFQGPLPTRLMQPQRKLFIIHHSVTQATDDPCADFRLLERIGKQRFGYLSYPYMVHNPSGVVGEGVGNHVGAHTGGYNSLAYAACLVGNFQNDEASPDAILAVCELLHVLRAFGGLVEKPLVLGHRQVPGASTACPGDNVVDKVLPWVRAVAADPDWVSPR